MGSRWRASTREGRTSTWWELKYKLLQHFYQVLQHNIQRASPIHRTLPFIVKTTLHKQWKHQALVTCDSFNTIYLIQVLQPYLKALEHHGKPRTLPWWVLQCNLSQRDEKDLSQEDARKASIGNNPWNWYKWGHCPGENFNAIYPN